MQSTRFSLALAGVLVFFGTAAGAAPRTETQRIEAAITSIQESNLTFVRNGDEHTAKAAADHMRSKLKKAGAKVKTFDEFIDALATQSSMSGKPYQLKLENGELVPLARWLRQRDAAAADAGK